MATTGHSAPSQQRCILWLAELTVLHARTLQHYTHAAYTRLSHRSRCPTYLYLVNWLHRWRWQHCGDVGIARGGGPLAVVPRADPLRSATCFLWSGLILKPFWTVIVCQWLLFLLADHSTLPVLVTVKPCFPTSSRALGTTTHQGSPVLRMTAPFSAICLG